MLRRLTIIAATLAPVPAMAAHACATGEPVTGTIASGTPASFRLEGSAQAFALSGLHMANPAVLMRNLSGLQVAIHGDGASLDRHNRMRGHLFVTSGRDRWVQGTILRQGLAIRTADEDNGPCARAMRRAEDFARRKRVGLWANPAYLAKSDALDDLATRVGQYVLVRGRVVSIGDRERSLYLNFGRRWSEDFTVVAGKTGARRYTGALERLQRLKGRTVIVRGVLQQAGGPMIRLVHDAQIQQVR